MVAPPKRLGILVGGGPAPGLNSAIGAATIEASNSGLEVLGFYDGFEHLMRGATAMVRPLTIADVSRIHFQGGSILRTSRASLMETPQSLERCVGALQNLGIGYLVTIGGDGTALGASELAQATLGVGLGSKGMVGVAPGVGVAVGDGLGVSVAGGRSPGLKGVRVGSGGFAGVWPHERVPATPPRRTAPARRQNRRDGPVPVGTSLAS